MKRKLLLMRSHSRGSCLPRIATFLLTALLSCISTMTFAYDFSAVNEDGVTIYYNYTNNTDAEVTSGESAYSGTVNIPKTVEHDGVTLNVTSIDSYAFSNCSSLTSVTIPDGVKSIDNWAFKESPNLASVIIPNSVTTIHYGAFWLCTGLTSVTIGSGVTKMDAYVFYGCGNLTKVIVKDIAAWCGISFYDPQSNPLYYAKKLYSDENTEIKNLEIPNGVTSIGQFAFEQCSNLTSVTIPNSVESIGKYAFGGCTGLTSANISSSMKSIGESVFYKCSSLTSINIPDNVTSIGVQSFANCTSLTAVTLPKTLSEIGDAAFSRCTGLTSITIPNSVKKVKGSTFFECTGLTSIIIPNSVTSIGERAFCGCSKLASVTIPSTVTSIEYRAFYECKSLTSITIPENVTSIGEEAFRVCTNLTEVTLLGKTLPKAHAGNEFHDIKMSQTTLYCVPTLEKACKTTNPWLRFGSIYPLVTLTSGERLSDYITDEIKNTVTKLKVVGEINSEDIALMKDMSTSGTLSVIDMSEATAASDDLKGDGAFMACKKLTSISLPKNVKSIGPDAFYGCMNLTSVTIPNSLEDIGDYAFCNCIGLTSINIPNSVTSIGEYAFCGCAGLTSINIPGSVTSINPYTFARCTGLTSVTIPNSVTKISDGAFNTCIGLTSINIPNSVTSITPSTFKNCIGLTSITIPNSVTSIDEYAFDGCSKLASIVIPNSVTSIGKSTFAGCSNLTEVTLQGTILPECEATAFDEISSDATLYCKAALIEICKDIAPWNNFNIVVNPFTIEISDAGIATGCFDDDLDFSEITGLKAYIASGFNPETGKVLMTNVTEVPAGTGFIVKGTEGTYEIPASATKYVYANLLVGTLKNTILQPTDEDTYTYYVLGKDTEDKAGFFLAKDDCEIPANKAYLQIPTSAVSEGASEAKALLRLDFDDEDGTITGIAPVKTVEEEMDGNTVIYNINGQRMQSLTRGLNIVNGKKIFIK